MPIHCRLAELRAKHGRQSLREVSERTKITAANLSRLERDLTTRIDLPNLEALCRHFSITPGDLLELVDGEPHKAATEPKQAEG